MKQRGAGRSGEANEAAEKGGPGEQQGVEQGNNEAGETGGLLPTCGSIRKPMIQHKAEKTHRARPGVSFVPPLFPCRELKEKKKC